MANPVVGWGASRADWLEARKSGIGASDVSGVLGFSRWSTPWQVWAVKTGRALWRDETSPAAELGNVLEPALLSLVESMVGVEAHRTEHRTYSHDDHAWRMCSPDGITADGRIVEIKTGGLISGYPPDGWIEGDGTPSVPLDYEMQARWAMSIMGSPAVEFVALIAGHGLIHRTVTRDEATENAMVAAVSDWWDHHVVGDVEPGVGPGDVDALKKSWPESDREEVELDEATWDAYQIWTAADAQVKAATERKKASEAIIRKNMRDATVGTFSGHTVAKFSTRKGNVDWKNIIDDLEIDVPDTENYRRPSTRVLKITPKKDTP